MKLTVQYRYDLKAIQKVDLVCFYEALRFFQDKWLENWYFIYLELPPNADSNKILDIFYILILIDSAPKELPFERGQRLRDAVRGGVHTRIRVVVFSQYVPPGFFIRIIGYQLQKGGGIKIMRFAPSLHCKSLPPAPPSLPTADYYFRGIGCQIAAATSSVTRVRVRAPRVKG